MEGYLPIEFRIDFARPEEADAVKNLLQLYQYDFSEFAGGVVLDEGLFPYHSDFEGKWESLLPRAFLLRALDVEPRSGEQAWHLAGFAMVTNASLLNNVVGPDQWFMEDFFVMRKYRRLGAGRTLAFHCFDTFRGRWEVAEYQINETAKAFWQRIIGEYTHGSFRQISKEDRIPWLVQVFDNTVAGTDKTR